MRRRNADVSTRALERDVARLISSDAGTPASPEFSRLVASYTRETGSHDLAMNRFFEVVAGTMGLVRDVERSLAEERLIRSARLAARLRGESHEILAHQESPFRLGMATAVRLTSAVAWEVERAAGRRPPDFSVYHYASGDVGEFDRHGPAYPWVRPSDFSGINIVDLPSGMPDVPEGCLVVERGDYHPVHIHNGSGLANEENVNADLLLAAQAVASGPHAVVSWWLLSRVKLAAQAVQGYAGFDSGSGNTLLIQRGSPADRADMGVAEATGHLNIDTIERFGSLRVGAWRVVTRAGAHGAVLVLPRSDLVLRSRSGSAVLSNRVGDEIYVWPLLSLDLPAAIADLERQGLLGIEKRQKRRNMDEAVVSGREATQARMRRNTDEQARRWERETVATGDVQARGRVLADRLRRGLVTQEHLSVAGYLGDTAAAQVVTPWAPVERANSTRAGNALLHGPINCVDLVRLAVDFADGVLDSRHESFRVAVEAARDWVAHPCVEHSQAAWTANWHAQQTVDAIRFMNSVSVRAGNAASWAALAAAIAGGGRGPDRSRNDPGGAVAFASDAAVDAVVAADGAHAREERRRVARQQQLQHMIAVLAGDLPSLTSPTQANPRRGDSLTRNSRLVPGDHRYHFVCGSLDAIEEDIRALRTSGKAIPRHIFVSELAPGEWTLIQKGLGFGPRGLQIVNDRSIGYYRGVFRGEPAVYLVFGGLEFVFTLGGKIGTSTARDAWRRKNPPGDKARLRRPNSRRPRGSITFWHGMPRERLPEILESGLEPGEGWGGAGTFGVYLSGSPEGALYWAKTAFQLAKGEKMEIVRFDRKYGKRASELLAIVSVTIPPEAIRNLRADMEQAEDVGFEGGPMDWEASLDEIGDVMYDGEVPAAWVREAEMPAEENDQ